MQQQTDCLEGSRIIFQFYEGFLTDRPSVNQYVVDEKNLTSEERTIVDWWRENDEIYYTD